MTADGPGVPEKSQEPADAHDHWFDEATRGTPGLTITR
ncbi:hypothetical protein J2S66_001831 [Saccharothrix longispora]|uniref:Uncharacterized protein n=1 Tax=Saccharothrix longispora TaxID=33920 RepID=A0ABU1PS27_9PSEU|nr:hypothetical protein [Saccharothrix longispora]